MSLQTGSKLAQTSRAIIDPEDLKVVAYEIEGSLLTEKPCFLITTDIRETGSVGMIVDSSDEFVGLSDVIKVQELYQLKFPLVDMTIVDKSGHKIGKVEDYAVDSSSFFIKQLSVKHGILKALGNTGRLIDRSQIVEINNRNIVIKTSEEAEPIVKSLRQEFVNPFSSSSTQSEAIDT